jgi:hypothetical protein
MNPGADLDLVRDLLPVSTEPSDAARREARVALLAAIGAERRVADAARPRRRVRTRGTRRLAAVCGALLLGAAGATGATVVAIDSFSHDTPTNLFRTNPDRIGNPWVRQSLVPGTVRRVETITVPGVGAAQYWTAQATHHGICVGLRLPGGVWAGSSDDRFQLGGPIPGCVYRFSPHPTAGWSPKRGFFWVEYQVGRGHWQGRVTFGTVPAVGRPVAVRDALTGTTTPVVDGRYFAILIPPSHGQWQSWKQGRTRILQLRYRLETVDAAGRVLAQSTETIEP